jgi:hypothetical protein
MMSLPPDHVGRLPSTALTRQVARTRACLFHRKLDAALAAGQAPWDSGDLMVRAAGRCQSRNPRVGPREPGIPLRYAAGRV